MTTIYHCKHRIFRLDTQVAQIDMHLIYMSHANITCRFENKNRKKYPKRTPRHLQYYYQGIIALMKEKCGHEKIDWNGSETLNSI